MAEWGVAIGLAVPLVLVFGPAMVSVLREAREQRRDPVGYEIRLGRERAASGKGYTDKYK